MRAPSPLQTPADVESRHLGPVVLRSRSVTRALPPCLFVPHTVMAWKGGGGAYTGEVLATMGVCTLQVRGRGGSSLAGPFIGPRGGATGWGLGLPLFARSGLCDV